METYHKIQTLFKRDMDGSLTGKKGKMIEGAWTTPELEYLADKQWEFTEKVDGTNIRIFCDVSYCEPDVYFAGRTDSAVIPKPLLEYLNETFTSELFENAGFMRQDGEQEHTVKLFGEGYGPKIQGGGKYRDDTSFVLFDVQIGDFWLSRENVNDIAVKLGIDSVPVIGQGTLYDAIEMVSPIQVTGHYMDLGGNVQELYDEPLESAWGPFEAEGIVARPVVDLFNRKGERIITKIKAVDFK